MWRIRCASGASVFFAVACATSVACIVLTVPAAYAQFGGLIRRATGAAEDELGRKIESLIRDGVRCAVGDSECVRKARESGKTPVMTDADGTVLIDARPGPQSACRDDDGVATRVRQLVGSFRFRPGVR